MEVYGVGIMLTQLGLRNFKSWEEIDIKFGPVNVLFGTNSSGKSSILQALLLLVQTQEKMAWQNVNFGGDKTDYVNLGSYRDVVFNHDTGRDITIGAYWWDGDWNAGKATIRFLEDKAQFEINDDLVQYIACLSESSFNASHFTYLGPLRQYPQRSYLWSGAIPRRIEPDGENTIAVLIASERSGNDLQQQVAEWLVKMELVDAFTTKALDPEKRFYETTVKIGNTDSSLLDVGFGVSQVLPVITTLFFVPEGSIVLLEQPELHLHPRAQAHLADLFLHVAEHRKLQLIVESHSEHLLRRLQRRIAEVESQFASPENIRMYFCDKGENGSTIQPVEIDEYGQIRNWPDKFFGDITGDLEKMTLAALQRSRNGH
jgi:predicted ATPase